jgi:hypothetical protein
MMRKRVLIPAVSIPGLRRNSRYFEKNPGGVVLQS